MAVATVERGLRVGIFLLDGDGGGEAVHEVDVGLLDAFEELAGVGGEGFDVAALALGVDGVEGERGLAGAADAADDGEGVVRDVDVDGLEVVGARAADGDGVAGDEDDARRVGLAGLRSPSLSIVCSIMATLHCRIVGPGLRIGAGSEASVVPQKFTESIGLRNRRSFDCVWSK